MLSHYRLLIVLLFISFQTAIAQSQTHLSKQLKEGDIIFQKLPCGSLCEAIIETTPCKPGLAFNHCGIVHIEGGNTYVIEAIGKAVKQSPLPDFLKRDTSSAVHVGRLKHASQKGLSDAVAKAKTYIGTPYDNAFLPGDKALYCSELVWESYKEQNSGPVFSLQPMTFKSPKTGQTFPAWADYYRDIKTEIPEGVPGINPCAIANSDKVEMMVFNLKGK